MTRYGEVIIMVNVYCGATIIVEASGELFQAARVV